MIAKLDHKHTEVQWHPAIAAHSLPLAFIISSSLSTRNSENPRLWTENMAECLLGLVDETDEWSSDRADVMTSTLGHGQFYAAASRSM